MPRLAVHRNSRISVISGHDYHELNYCLFDLISLFFSLQSHEEPPSGVHSVARLHRKGNVVYDNARIREKAHVLRFGICGKTSERVIRLR
jgi:hypothetical protein